MAIYNVNYDLRQPGRDYGDLMKELEKFPNWCHFLKSSWFVASDRSARQVLDQLRARIDANDGLVVSEVRKGSSAWVGLTEKVSDWIRQNL